MEQVCLAFDLRVRNGQLKLSVIYCRLMDAILGIASHGIRDISGICQGSTRQRRACTCLRTTSHNGDSLYNGLEETREIGDASKDLW
jgi:hypothetical protein